MRREAIVAAAYKRALARLYVLDECICYNGAGSGHPADDGMDHKKIRVRDEHGRRKLWYVHRVSYEYHFGPIPDELVVRHKCARRACFAPYHLVLGTASDNMQDMMRHGHGKMQFKPRYTAA